MSTEPTYDPSADPPAPVHRWDGETWATQPGQPVNASSILPSERYRPAPRRVDGALTVLAGLACLAGAVATSVMARHGGIVWTGGALVGCVLIARGAARLVGRELPPITRQSKVPGWLAVLLLAPIGLLTAFAIVGALFSMNAGAGSPGQENSSIPYAAHPRATAAPAAPKSWWPTGYEPVGPDGAVMVDSIVVASSCPESGCVSYDVVTRKPCAHAVVTVNLYRSDAARPSGTRHYTVRHVTGPRRAVQIVVGTPEWAERASAVTVVCR